MIEARDFLWTLNPQIPWPHDFLDVNPTSGIRLQSLVIGKAKSTTKWDEDWDAAKRHPEVKRLLRLIEGLND